MIRAVVFDLDGTLIDGYDAIHEALAFATGRLGCPVPTPGELRTMVGHGLEQLLARAVGPERADEGVRLFRERYPEVAVAGSHLLPGVPGVLEALRAGGRRLALASNKPPRFSRLILEEKGIAPLFDALVGPNDVHPPKPDPSMLRALLGELRCAPEEAVCVGDMEVDVAFGRAAGCRAIVVPTGSRSRDFLEACGADALIDGLDGLPAALDALD